MPLAETQMYIFRIELRSFLFGWNALAAQCNRKRPLRSITFLFHNACKTADLDENPLRKLCVLCASAVNGSSKASSPQRRRGRRVYAEILGFALDTIPPAIIITVYYATPSMPYDCFLRVVKHAKILRTKHHAGAKSTPNTPLIFRQERK
jgi:hypothetical protein